MSDSEILIIGSNGQLGTALKLKYPEATAVDINELDITDFDAMESFDWSKFKIILNAAAYTNVDGAETPDGRRTSWRVNAMAVAHLAKAAISHDLLVVHISTDYVFDGVTNPHLEDEPLSPLNVYGATKAAGDLAISNVTKHYILRTSFVIGEGNNFVRIMLDLGKKGVNPKVISDQAGRVTFTSELVRAINHLLTKKSPFGVYNISNGGQPISWADLTRDIFDIARLKNTVTNTTTGDYYKDKPGSAPRPLNSVLDLAKIESTGFKPVDWKEDLAKYIKKELSK